MPMRLAGWVHLVLVLVIVATEEAVAVVTRAVRVLRAQMAELPAAAVLVVAAEPQLEEMVAQEDGEKRLFIPGRPN